jgi:hypothetical protein
MERQATGDEPIVPAYSAFRSGPAGRAFNEAAFRYFLGVDRQRASRSMRSLLLVLVTLRQPPVQRARLNDDAAAALFAGLGDCVRDVDFVGWYREGYVAGAVMPQPGNAPGDVLHRVRERVIDALRQRFPDEPPETLRVRVIRLGAKARG